MRLTDNQGSVYRTIRDEELRAGATIDEASRTAYEFMRDDALPDWRAFWRDWNAPPGILELYLQLTTGLVLAQAIARHPAIVSGPLKQIGDVFRMLVGVDE